VLLTPGAGIQFNRRTTTGGMTSGGNLTGITAPCWIKLTRIGDTLSAFYSANGTTWTQFDADRTVTMGATVAIGLVVCSHADGVLCTSTMDSVIAAP
jgi:hypothetical protein